MQLPLHTQPTPSPEPRGIYATHTYPVIRYAGFYGSSDTHLRETLAALRAAAEIATKRGHGEIKPGDIDDSYAQARHRIRQLNLQSLPFHHHVLYALIHAADRLDAGTLHERYDTVAEAVYADYRATPVGKRSRRNKLQKLIAYDLILRDGPDHDPIYAVVDRDVNPELKMPPLLEE